MRKLLVVMPLLSLMGAQCGDSGNCTVTKDAATGVATVACPDGTSVDVAPGQNGTNGTDGQNGTNCTVTKNPDAGESTIACADGTTATVDDGADGAQGPAGDAGMLLMDTEPPGVNCANGGIKLTSGAEVEYVCNGTESHLLGVNAGSDQTVTVGATATLAGSTNNQALGMRWNQLLGPTLNLSNVQSPTATFTVPAYIGASMRKVVLQLLATDGVRLESDLVVLTLNSAPTAPVVALTPSSPADADDIVCSVTTPSTDSDGDAVTYQFSWTRNGQPFAGAVATSATMSSVPASSTAPGDVFGCSAVGVDGATNGPSAAVAYATVLGVCSSARFGPGFASIATSSSGIIVGPSTTVEYWVRDDVAPSANGAWQVVGQRHTEAGAWWSIRRGQSVVAFEIGRSGTDFCAWTVQAPVAGAWAHIAWVLDSQGNVSAFVNGVPSVVTNVHACVYAAQQTVSSYPLTFGGYSAQSNLGMMGNLSALRISSSARYSGAFVPGKSWLVDATTSALFALDEGYGTVAHDGSVFSRDAQLSAGSWAADCP